MMCKWFGQMGWTMEENEENTSKILKIYGKKRCRR
jgi:hypothetical protein